MNPNIMSAYLYSDSDYITGEEKSCVATACSQNKIVNSCAPGTIIKYTVNDSTIRKFYVLHNDENTFTLQDSVNTV